MNSFHIKLLLPLLFFIYAISTGWANSVSLVNNSIYTLKATIYDANETFLGQFVINPGEATQWSYNYQNLNFGSANNYESMAPYTVNWFCMNGSPYGTCTYVAAGAVVTAQSCGGVQE